MLSDPGCVCSGDKRFDTLSFPQVLAGEAGCHLWPLRPSHSLSDPRAKLLRPPGPRGHFLAMGLGWRVASRGCPRPCPPPFPFRPREGSKENGGARSKRALEEEEAGTDVLSKNKQKKQLRNPHKTFDPSLKRELFPLPGTGGSDSYRGEQRQGLCAVPMRSCSHLRGRAGFWGHLPEKALLVANTQRIMGAPGGGGRTRDCCTRPPQTAWLAAVGRAPTGDSVCKWQLGGGFTSTNVCFCSFLSKICKV